MHRSTKVLPVMVLLCAGCSTTKQLVPRPSSQTVSSNQARITINDSRYAYPPLNVKDQKTEIGAIGRKGALTWDRPAGLCSIELHTVDSSMTGQAAGLQSVWMADLRGGQSCTLDLVRNKGNFSLQPTASSANEIRMIQIPVCVLPAIDDTNGKCIDLQRYVKAYDLPAAKCGTYFPSSIALDQFNMWGYTKPVYGGGESDLPAIYAAAKKGTVPDELLPAQDHPSYYVLLAVRQFEDFFRIMWVIDSVVDCYAVRATDGKVVYRGTGKGSCRAGALDIDQKFMVKYGGLDGTGNSWVWAIDAAVKNSLKDMPILTP